MSDLLVLLSICLAIAGSLVVYDRDWPWKWFQKAQAPAVALRGAASKPSKPNGGDSDSRPSGAEMLGDAAFSPDSIRRRHAHIERVKLETLAHFGDSRTPIKIQAWRQK